MSFIKKEEVFQNLFRDVTYVKEVCDVREGKVNKNRTRLTVGVVKIEYPGNCGTAIANLLILKLLLNIIISNLGETFMMIYIKTFTWTHH